MAGETLLMRDFIAEFRTAIDDTSGSVMASSIISYLNTALQRLGLHDGLDKLFYHHDSFELSKLNQDGSYSAAWDLGKIGQIIDIPNIKLLSASGPDVRRIPVRFMTYDQFFDMCGLPEQNAPGTPTVFTVEQLGTINRLLLDRPPDGLVSLDMRYSCFHPRITSPNDNVQVDYAYWNVLIEYCKILQKQSATDFDEGRALYEDLDLLTTELANRLAARKTGLPYRRMRRSF
jgi:hypothetical protein